MADAEKYSTKILTDAKAAASPSEAFGTMATGEFPLNEDHTPAGAGFNTGKTYRDVAPFGSRAEKPTSGAGDREA